MQCPIRKRAFPLLILLLGFFASAEERPAEPPPKPEIPNLHAIVAPSGYVFSGTVKAVERIKPHSPRSVAVMRITFYVDHGYHGVRTGQTFSIHEWAGLWQSGDRYRPGEHVMLFLYPASRLGLTSPVPNGRFPVDSGGRIVVPPSRHPAGTSPLHSQPPPSLRIDPGDFGRLLRRAEQE
jgi:hypothetical protein